MCKILVVAGVAENKQRALMAFVRGALPAMTKHDKDGVGYAAAAIGSGELFGERWLHPGAAFKRRSPLTPHDARIADELRMAVDVEESYSAFGQLDQPIGAMLLHTRMATCGVGIHNTHPFVRDDTALIHNGIISNPDVFKRTLSTCDSEAILSGYLDCGVDQHVDSMDDMTSQLDGYYACGVLARDRDGVRILDVFKANGATLYVAWVKSLDTLVYATTPEILRSAAKAARTKISRPHKVNSEWLIRIDALSGRVRGTHRFSARRRPVSYGVTFNPAFGKEDDARDMPPDDLESTVVTSLPDWAKQTA